MSAYFQRTWYLSFGHTTQYNSFSCWQKIMLGSCSSYRYVNYAGFLLTLFQALSEVIPTMNFLSRESQEWAVNSSVHLVSKISFTIKLQSYIKWVSQKLQVLVYIEKDACPLTFKFENKSKIAPWPVFSVVRASAYARYDPWPRSGACAGSSHFMCLSHWCLPLLPSLNINGKNILEWRLKKKSNC